MSESQLPLVKFSIPDAVVEELRERLTGLTADTPKGYREVMAGLADTRKIRVAIKKKHKELKADALQWGRVVDGEAKRLIQMLVEIEEPLRITRAEADEKKEAEIQAKKEAERKEREAKKEAERKEREAKEAAERKEREAKEAAERKEREAKEAAERAKRERVEKVARAKRERVEKVDREKRESKHKAEMKVAREKLAELQAEHRKKIAAEKIEREETRTKEQAELKAQLEEAKRKDAEAQKILDEQAAKDSEIREKADAAKRLAADREARAEFAPDIELLRNYMLAINDVQTPPVISKQGRQFIDDLLSDRMKSHKPIWQAINDHDLAEQDEEPQVTKDAPVIAG